MVVDLSDVGLLHLPTLTWLPAEGLPCNAAQRGGTNAASECEEQSVSKSSRNSCSWTRQFRRCLALACAPHRSLRAPDLITTSTGGGVALARSLAVGQRFISSSRCHNHAVSLDTPGFVAPGCGGVSLQAALLRFLDAAAHGSSTPRLELPQLALEQQCNDFDCCCGGRQSGEQAL